MAAEWIEFGSCSCNTNIIACESLEQMLDTAQVLDGQIRTSDPAGDIHCEHEVWCLRQDGLSWQSDNHQTFKSFAVDLKQQKHKYDDSNDENKSVGVTNMEVISLKACTNKYRQALYDAELTLKLHRSDAYSRAGDGSSYLSLMSAFRANQLSKVVVEKPKWRVSKIDNPLATHDVYDFPRCADLRQKGKSGQEFETALKPKICSYNDTYETSSSDGEAFPCNLFSIAGIPQPCPVDIVVMPSWHSNQSTSTRNSHSESDSSSAENPLGVPDKKNPNERSLSDSSLTQHPSPSNDCTVLDKQPSQQLQDKQVPPDDQLTLPPDDQQSMPPGDQQSISSDHQKTLPSDEQQPMPLDNQQSLPPNFQQSSLLEDQQPLPQNDQQPLPSDDQHPLPSDSQQPLSSNVQQPSFLEDQQPLPSHIEQSISSDDRKTLPPDKQQSMPSGDQQPLPLNVQQSFLEDQKPLPSDDQQPLPSDDQQSLPSDDQQSLPLDDQQSLPLDGKQSLPLDGKQSLPLDGKQSLPLVDLQSLPLDGKQSLPLDGKQSLPLDGKQSLPLDGKQSLPLDGKQSLPLDGKQSLPLVDLQSLPLDGKQSLPLDGKQSLPLDDLQSLPLDDQQPPSLDVQQTPPVEVQETPPVEVQETPPVEVQETPPVEVQETPPVEVQLTPPVEVQKPLLLDIQQPLLLDVQQPLPLGVQQLLPLGDQQSLSLEDQQPPPLEVQEPLPLGDRQPLPLDVQQPLPLDVQQPLPLDVQQPLPLDVQQPLPLDVQQPLPLDVQQPLPLDVQQPLPPDVQQPLPLDVQQPLSVGDQQPLSLEIQQTLHSNNQMSEDFNRHSVFCDTVNVEPKPHDLATYHHCHAQQLSSAEDRQPGFVDEQSLLLNWKNMQSFCESVTERLGHNSQQTKTRTRIVAGNSEQHDRLENQDEEGMSKAVLKPSPPTEWDSKYMHKPEIQEQSLQSFTGVALSPSETETPSAFNRPEKFQMHFSDISDAETEVEKNHPQVGSSYLASQLYTVEVISDSVSDPEEIATSFPFTHPLSHGRGPCPKQVSLEDVADTTAHAMMFKTGKEQDSFNSSPRQIVDGSQTEIFPISPVLTVLDTPAATVSEALAPHKQHMHSLERESSKLSVHKEENDHETTKNSSIHHLYLPALEMKDCGIGHSVGIQHSLYTSHRLSEGKKLQNLQPHLLNEVISIPSNAVQQADTEDSLPSIKSFCQVGMFDHNPTGLRNQMSFNALGKQCALSPPSFSSSSDDLDPLLNTKLADILACSSLVNKKEKNKSSSKQTTNSSTSYSQDINGSSINVDRNVFNSFRIIQSSSEPASGTNRIPIMKIQKLVVQTSSGTGNSSSTKSCFEKTETPKHVRENIFSSIGNLFEPDCHDENPRKDTPLSKIKGSPLAIVADENLSYPKHFPDSGQISVEKRGNNTSTTGTGVKKQSKQTDASLKSPILSLSVDNDYLPPCQVKLLDIKSFIKRDIVFLNRLSAESLKILGLKSRGGKGFSMREKHTHIAKASVKSDMKKEDIALVLKPVMARLKQIRAQNRQKRIAEVVENLLMISETQGNSLNVESDTTPLLEMSAGVNAMTKKNSSLDRNVKKDQMSKKKTHVTDSQKSDEKTYMALETDFSKDSLSKQPKSCEEKQPILCKRPEREFYTNSPSKKHTAKKESRTKSLENDDHPITPFKRRGTSPMKKVKQPIKNIEKQKVDSSNTLKFPSEPITVVKNVEKVSPESAQESKSSRVTKEVQACSHVLGNSSIKCPAVMAHGITEYHKEMKENHDLKTPNENMTKMDHTGKQEKKRIKTTCPKEQPTCHNKSDRKRHSTKSESKRACDKARDKLKISSETNENENLETCDHRSKGTSLQISDSEMSRPLIEKKVDPVCSEGITTKKETTNATKHPKPSLSSNKTRRENKANKIVKKGCPPSKISKLKKAADTSFGKTGLTARSERDSPVKNSSPHKTFSMSSFKIPKKSSSCSDVRPSCATNLGSSLSDICQALENIQDRIKPGEKRDIKFESSVSTAHENQVNSKERHDIEKTKPKPKDHSISSSPPPLSDKAGKSCSNRAHPGGESINVRLREGSQDEHSSYNTESDWYVLSDSLSPQKLHSKASEKSKISPALILDPRDHMNKKKFSSGKGKEDYKTSTVTGCIQQRAFTSDDTLRIVDSHQMNLMQEQERPDKGDSSCQSSQGGTAQPDYHTAGDGGDNATKMTKYYMETQESYCSVASKKRRKASRKEAKRQLELQDFLSSFSLGDVHDEAKLSAPIVEDVIIMYDSEEEVYGGQQQQFPQEQQYLQQIQYPQEHQFPPQHQYPQQQQYSQQQQYPQKQQYPQQHQFPQQHQYHQENQYPQQYQHPQQQQYQQGQQLYRIQKQQLIPKMDTFRGKDVQQIARDRKNRRDHPYNRPERTDWKTNANRYSTFDLAYRDLEELMQCLTAKTFRIAKKQRQNLANMPDKGCRFQGYTFVRLAPSEEAQDEVETDSLIRPEDIKDFEVRRQMADEAEELAEQLSLIQDNESSDIEEGFLEDFIVLDETQGGTSPPSSMTPVCSSTPGHPKKNLESKACAETTNINLAQIKYEASEEKKVQRDEEKLSRQTSSNLFLTLAAIADQNKRETDITYKEHQRTSCTEFQEQKKDLILAPGSNPNKQNKVQTNCQDFTAAGVENKDGKMPNSKVLDNKNLSQKSPNGQNEKPNADSKDLPPCSDLTTQLEDRNVLSIGSQPDKTLKEKNLNSTQPSIKPTSKKCINFDAGEKQSGFCLIKTGLSSGHIANGTARDEDQKEHSNNTLFRPKENPVQCSNLQDKSQPIERGHIANGTARDEDQKQFSNETPFKLEENPVQCSNLDNYSQPIKRKQHAGQKCVNNMPQVHLFQQPSIPQQGQQINQALDDASGHLWELPYHGFPPWPLESHSQADPTPCSSLSNSITLSSASNAQSGAEFVFHPYRSEAATLKSHSNQTCVQPAQINQSYLPEALSSSDLRPFNALCKQKDHNFSHNSRGDHIPGSVTYQQHDLSQVPSDTTHWQQEYTMRGFYKSCESSLPVKNEHHMSETINKSKSSLKSDSHLVQIPGLMESKSTKSLGHSLIDTKSRSKFPRTSSGFDIDTVSTFLADPAQYSHDVSLADKSLSQEGEQKDIPACSQQSSPPNVFNSEFVSAIQTLNTFLTESLRKSSTKADCLPKSESLQDPSLRSTPESQLPSNLCPSSQSSNGNAAGSNPSMASQLHTVRTTLTHLTNGSRDEKGDGRSRKTNSSTSELLTVFSQPPPPPPPQGPAQNTSPAGRASKKKVKSRRSRSAVSHSSRQSKWNKMPVKITFEKTRGVYKPNPDLKKQNFHLLDFNTYPTRDPRLRQPSKRERDRNRKLDSLKSSTNTIKIVKVIPLQPIEKSREPDVMQDQAKLLDDTERKLSCESHKVASEKNPDTKDTGNKKELKSETQIQEEVKFTCGDGTLSESCIFLEGSKKMASNMLSVNVPERNDDMMENQASLSPNINVSDVSQSCSKTDELAIHEDDIKAELSRLLDDGGKLFQESSSEPLSSTTRMPAIEMESKSDPAFDFSSNKVNLVSQEWNLDKIANQTTKSVRNDNFSLDQLDWLGNRSPKLTFATDMMDIAEKKQAGENDVITSLKSEKVTSEATPYTSSISIQELHNDCSSDKLKIINDSEKSCGIRNKEFGTTVESNGKQNYYPKTCSFENAMKDSRDVIDGKTKCSLENKYMNSTYDLSNSIQNFSSKEEVDGIISEACSFENAKKDSRNVIGDGKATCSLENECMNGTDDLSNSSQNCKNKKEVGGIISKAKTDTADHLSDVSEGELLSSKSSSASNMSLLHDSKTEKPLGNNEASRFFPKQISLSGKPIPTVEDYQPKLNKPKLKDSSPMCPNYFMQKLSSPLHSDIWYPSSQLPLHQHLLEKFCPLPSHEQKKPNRCKSPPILSISGKAKGEVNGREYQSGHAPSSAVIDHTTLDNVTFFDGILVCDPVTLKSYKRPAKSELQQKCERSRSPTKQKCQNGPIKSKLKKTHKSSRSTKSHYRSRPKDSSRSRSPKVLCRSNSRERNRSKSPRLRYRPRTRESKRSRLRGSTMSRSPKLHCGLRYRERKISRSPNSHNRSKSRENKRSRSPTLHSRSISREKRFTSPILHPRSRSRSPTVHRRLRSKSRDQQRSRSPALRCRSRSRERKKSRSPTLRRRSRSRRSGRSRSPTLCRISRERRNSRSPALRRRSRERERSRSPALCRKSRARERSRSPALYCRSTSRENKRLGPRASTGPRTYERTKSPRSGRSLRSAISPPTYESSSLPLESYIAQERAISSYFVYNDSRVPQFYQEHESSLYCNTSDKNLASHVLSCLSYHKPRSPDLPYPEHEKEGLEKHHRFKRRRKPSVTFSPDKEISFPPVQNYGGNQKLHTLANEKQLTESSTQDEYDPERQQAKTKHEKGAQSVPLSSEICKVIRGIRKDEANKVSFGQCLSGFTKTKIIHPNDSNERKRMINKKSKSFEDLTMNRKQKKMASKKKLKRCFSDPPQISEKTRRKTPGIIMTTTEALMKSKSLAILLDVMAGMSKYDAEWSLEVHTKSMVEMHDKRYGCELNSPEFHETERCIALINEYQLKGVVKMVRQCMCRSKQDWSLDAAIQCLRNRSKPGVRSVLLCGDKTKVPKISCLLEDMEFADWKTIFTALL